MMKRRKVKRNPKGNVWKREVWWKRKQETTRRSTRRDQRTSQMKKRIKERSNEKKRRISPIKIRGSEEDVERM